MSNRKEYLSAHHYKIRQGITVIIMLISPIRKRKGAKQEVLSKSENSVRQLKLTQKQSKEIYEKWRKAL